MGYGPDQVDRWEPWQIAAVYTTWREANTPPTTKAPTDAEFRAAVAATVH